MSDSLGEFFRRFDEALARAHECDAYLKLHGGPIGPLHGLPISVKDSFNVKGVQSAIGYVSFLANPPASSNSAVVQTGRKNVWRELRGSG